MYSRIVIAATVIVAIAAAPLHAGYCPAPQYEDTYVLDDGTMVDVYVQNPGFYGESCTGGGEDSSGGGGSTSGFGRGPGTAHFDFIGTASQLRAAATVRFADGTSMKMNGPPKVRNGRFAFTNDVGQLVQLPLEEVVATDSGRQYPCRHCAHDAAGRALPSMAVRAAFVAAHPCPAPDAKGDACPGYAVVHVTPIACGGEDDVLNLQWENADRASAERAWANKACGH